MKSKLLSIIIPAYNVEFFLTKAVTSLSFFLNNEKVEIFIINDGSTDDTELIGHQLSNQFSNITVVTQENMGLSAARNVGLKQVNGTYTYFYDGDDFLNSVYLKDIFMILEQTSVDILSFGYAQVDDDGTELNRHLFKDDSFYISLSKADYIHAIIGGGTDPVAGYLPTKIIRTSLIRTLRFRQMNYEDMPFVFELLENENIHSILYLNRVVYNYVQRKDSITHSITYTNLSDKLLSLWLVNNSLNKMGVSKKVLCLNNERMLIQALWVSSLNIKFVRSRLVASNANRLLRMLFSFSGSTRRISLYLRLKTFYYLIINVLLRFIYFR
ncbi:glycosyl transferase [Furfurilactobacillus curtus]|uniref:Glycosyl transferase n=2 Tax=Furfurilactobacillus curtus TaxID=1746200 RepID=A0ABQ5JQS5_9LACO